MKSDTKKYILYNSNYIIYGMKSELWFFWWGQDYWGSRDDEGGFWVSVMLYLLI